MSTRCTTDPAVARILRFAADEVVPRLAGTTDELDAGAARARRRLHPGRPVGSPLRGLVNVLPTGRNFYSVDPKAVPSRLAWETGVAMADSLLERYLADTASGPDRSACRCGAPRRCAPPATTSPRCSRCSAYGRSGTTPPAGSSTLEAIPLAELGRPRIDVTVRISGFFRDAFPHVVTMLDDAVQLVAGLDEPAEQNYVRAHAQADLRRARRRTSLHDTDLRLQARHVRRRPPAADRQPQLARRRRPRRGLHGVGRLRLRPRPRRRAGEPTTCDASTAGSRWRPRTSTPASTTSPTPTTTSSTTAAWSPPCAR